MITEKPTSADGLMDMNGKDPMKKMLFREYELSKDFEDLIEELPVSPERTEIEAIILNLDMDGVDNHPLSNKHKAYLDRKAYALMQIGILIGRLEERTNEAIGLEFLEDLNE